MELPLVPDVADLTRRCAVAMAQYRCRQPHDAAACYALFRLALTERNQAAWAALYSQYAGLVRYWLGATPDDGDALVNRTFTHLWQAIPPDRFTDFPTLDHCLAFLERCAQHIAIDAWRAVERERLKEQALAQMQSVFPSLALENNPATSEIETLYVYIHQRLNGTEEEIVFQTIFEWDLKPQSIAARWPDLFADARAVSRVKERFLRRLRRDVTLRQLLGLPPVDGGNCAE